MNDHKTFGTCRHWGWKFEVDVTLPDAGPLGRVSIKRAPCLIQAVEPDAGDGAVVLLGPESHCRCHLNAWEPSDDFQYEQEQGADDFGVLPGVDFPATLPLPSRAF